MPSFDLVAEGKPQFSQLPLEADVLIIRKSKSGKWSKHPLFQHLSEYTLFEFKSVNDPFKFHHWGKLMAYVGLTMELKKLPAEAEVGAWLIVPYINKSLRTMLDKHKIQLSSFVSGLHTGHTGLFPLVIIEYNHLPLEPDYYELKTFMKEGDELKVSILALLKSLAGSKLLEEYTTIITSIHKQEAAEMIEILEQDKQNFQEMAELMLTKMGDDIELLPTIYRVEQKSKLEGKLETVQRILQNGMDIEFAANVTGISVETLKQLLKLK